MLWCNFVSGMASFIYRMPARTKWWDVLMARVGFSADTHA